MFDHIDTPLPSFDNSGREFEPAAAAVPRQPLARQHAGRNWARFAARPGSQASLLRLHDVALHLDAQVEKLADGGLLVLGLSLNETLSLAERFGDELAVEAGIAGRAHYPA